MRGIEPFVANTDRRWFDFLASRAREGRVDEVNFWSPRATRPMRAMAPGEPVFFRLKSPWNAVAGYGFFAHFAVFALDEAWRLFDWRNGDGTEEGFLERIGGFRGVDLRDDRVPRAPLGCTVLRDARFWPASRWLPWGEREGWAPNIVQGRAEQDVGRAAVLLASVAEDAVHLEVEAELRPAPFLPLEGDDRLRREALMVIREGQGTFRARVLDAYGRSCAVTGEHTEPVLDAAHIQPYLGPRSNHVQNGIVLTKEFHTLFDMGFVGITRDYRVRISPALKDRWHNGHRYYAYDDRPLARLPTSPGLRPSTDALEWHRRYVFVA